VNSVAEIRISFHPSNVVVLQQHHFTTHARGVGKNRIPPPRRIL